MNIYLFVMSFNILHFDVLLEIIKYLSFEDVINLSKVNKSMFSITTHKYVIRIFREQIIDRFINAQCYETKYICFNDDLDIEENSRIYFNKLKIEKAVNNNSDFGGYEKLVKNNEQNKLCSISTKKIIFTYICL